MLTEKVIEILESCDKRDKLDAKVRSQTRLLSEAKDKLYDLDKELRDKKNQLFNILHKANINDINVEINGVIHYVHLSTSGINITKTITVKEAETRCAINKLDESAKKNGEDIEDIDGVDVEYDLKEDKEDKSEVIKILEDIHQKLETMEETKFK